MVGVGKDKKQTSNASVPKTSIIPGHFMRQVVGLYPVPILATRVCSQSD